MKPASALRNLLAVLLLIASSLSWAGSRTDGFKIILIGPAQARVVKFPGDSDFFNMRRPGAFYQCDATGHLLDFSLVFLRSLPPGFSYGDIESGLTGKVRAQRHLQSMLRAVRDEDIPQGLDAAFMVTAEDGQLKLTGLSALRGETPRFARQAYSGEVSERLVRDLFCAILPDMPMAYDQR